MRLVLALAASLLTIGGAAADDAAKRFSGDVALLMSLQDATAAGHGNATILTLGAGFNSKRTRSAMAGVMVTCPVSSTIIMY